MKLHYHKYIRSAEEHERLIAMLSESGIWLYEHLGDATELVELNDRSALPSDRETLNKFLFEKIKTMLWPLDNRRIDLATWSACAKYSALCVTSGIDGEPSYIHHHDMVLTIYDEHDALQFKLAVA